MTLLAITRLSHWANERTFVALLQNLWTLPCIIALRVWPGAMSNMWGTYALVTVLLSYPYCHAIAVGWASRNSNNVGTRTVSAALYNSEYSTRCDPNYFLLTRVFAVMVQLGNVIANNIYRNDDKPKYHRGNTNLIIINCISIGVFLFAKFYYVTRNKRREAKWNAMTPEVRLISLPVHTYTPLTCTLYSNGSITPRIRQTRAASVLISVLRTRRFGRVEQRFTR